MSEISYLEKLLDGADVEWLSLGKILVRTKGTKITAGQMKVLHKDNAPLKIFAGGKTVAFVDYKDIPEKDINRKPSIIVKSRGVIEFEFYDKPFSHKNEMWSYHSKNETINIKYIYYFLKMNEAHFQKIGGKMQMPQISTPDTDKFRVPIPCPANPEKSLAIQSAIVRILDKFTALTAELTAELSMRKKQYNYYRDQLLSFDDGGAEWKTLGEITRKIASGRNKTRQAEGDFPVYGSTGLLGFTNEPAYAGNLLLVARVGAYAGLVNAVSGHFDVSDNTLIIHPSDSWNARFAFHQLTHMNLNQYAVGAGQPLITGGLLKNLKVPVPSLDEQTRIAKILDKFETMTVSITEGLPREIELRRTQYEYYRDMLFNFPKPEEAEA